MKKMIAAAILTAFAATTAFAADEIITYKIESPDFAKTHAPVSVNVTKHKKNVPGFPGVPSTLTKEKAHKLCTGCHATKKAGPTRCGECHKKK